MTGRLDSPDYRAAVGDLLGMLACGELSAFSRLAADAELAPTLALRGRMSRFAVAGYEHFGTLVACLEDVGGDPETAVAAYTAHFAAFHERTRPSNWLEGVVKAYVGDGIATDFHREIAAYVDQPVRAVIEQVLDVQERSAFLVQVVRDAVAADPLVAGRLALWARRLVGEALSQAQTVAADRQALAALLSGEFGGPSADLAELGRMFARLTEAHVDRMGRLGLSS